MKVIFTLAIVSWCAVISETNIFGRKQTVEVTGRVLCPRSPISAKNVLVKLVDNDFMGRDDLMGKVKTDGSGRFHIKGSAKEIGRIDPTLKIYHRCNNFNPCARYWKVEIPKSYINKGVFNVGDLNLEMKWNDEGHDCIHW